MKKPISLSAWLIKARRSLHTKTTTPFLEAQVLAALALEKPKEWVIAHSDIELQDGLLVALDKSLELLVSGMPLAYISNQQDFYGLSFYINKDVLIPRPESEQLIDLANCWIKKQETKELLGLDIGTGSGCLAIALAKCNPSLTMLASDISSKALLVAKKNLDSFNLMGRVFLVQSDCLPGISRKADVILTNPPYIPSNQLLQLDVSRYEPHAALDGGCDGLNISRRILLEAKNYLNCPSILLMELESSLATKTKKIAEGIFTSSQIDIIDDLAGLPRILRVTFEKQN